MFLFDVLARLCLAAFFLWSGYGTINSLDATTRAVFEFISPFYPSLPNALASGRDYYPQALTATGVVVELLGATLLIFGYKARFGAFILAVLLAVTTLTFHRFWGNVDPQLVLNQPILYDEGQLTQFLKNLGVFGGLLLVLRHGAGYLSLDGSDYRNR